MSLFIPFVFPNFDQNYVTQAFATVGDVNHVDFVAKLDRKGRHYNAAYIHFNYWHDNEINRVVQFNVSRNNLFKWYHDESKYYWIVLPNHSKKYIPGERKPRITLDNHAIQGSEEDHVNQFLRSEIERLQKNITEQNDALKHQIDALKHQMRGIEEQCGGSVQGPEAFDDSEQI